VLLGLYFQAESRMIDNLSLLIASAVPELSDKMNRIGA